MAENYNTYGGQAVLEGVMFGGKSVHVTAVRRKNQEITFLEVPKTEVRWTRMLKKIPFLRGLVAIVESSAKGARHLNFSAEIFAEEEGEVKVEDEKPGLFDRISLVLGVAVIGVLSFLFGKLIFTLVPAVLEELLFTSFFENQILHNLIEGLIKIVLLIGYIYFISLTPPIKRLFQYHGAEHKVISTYEAGEELTVENVRKHTRLHYRCGSSFIVLTVLIGVIIYSFFKYETMLDRIILRVVLIPVVIGVSYEALRFTNSLRDVPVLRYLGYPGLWLQKLTTKEPDDSQIEVSIASFTRMRELDAKENLVHNQAS